MYPKKLTIRAALTLVVFVIVLGGLCVMNRIAKPPEVSQSERRPLAVMPAVTLPNITSARFMSEFEGFAADSFAFRDSFRGIRAFTILYPFMQTDKTGLYYDSAVGAGKFERVSEKNLLQFSEKIQKIADGLSGLNIYYSFIPDKDVYADRAFPGFDVDMVSVKLSEEIKNIPYINLADILTADDFYRSDFHWNQIELGNVISELGAAMGFDVNTQLLRSAVAGDFHGVYAGQLALPIDYDKMEYLIPQDSVSARYFDEKTREWENGEIYDTAAFNGRDPYDMLLRGVEPLIVLENSDSSTERELYLFRDSFASSLAPLLTPAYRKITLIDLRYIDYSFLTELVSFEKGSDVLFLYSSLVLNNPSLLLIK